MDSKLTPPQRFPEGTAAAVAAPPPPAAPFFDPLQNAWVLSRYGDVAAALREPVLRPVGPQKSAAHLREDVASTLSQSEISDWQQRIEPLADRIIMELPLDRPIDLVSEVLRPWSLAVTTIVLSLDAAAGRQLATLQPQLSHGSAGPPSPRGPFKRVRHAVQRRIAKVRLKRLLRGLRVPGAQSLFLGLTQTLPDFLANAWLGLLENRSQIERLRAEPHLMPRAIEELLRHSGPVHTLSRQANQTVEVAGIKIARGQSVLLKVASANRDPEQFSDPNALDVGRRSSGHLGLGAGPHSCIGALLVRMAAIPATRAFADRLAAAELVDPIVWRHGTVHASPYSLRVRCRLIERSDRATITPSPRTSDYLHTLAADKCDIAGPAATVIPSAHFRKCAYARDTRV